MGLNNTYGLGRNVRACVQTEAGTAFGGIPASGFVGADSFQVYGGVTVEPSEDRKVRMDARQTRSAVELIIGDRATSATVRTYILPPNDPGSGSSTQGLPDVHDLLLAAMGSATIGAATVSYSLSALQNLPPSLAALFEYNAVKSDLLLGWVIEEFRINIPNGDEPTFEFVGPARQQIHTGNATAATALAASPAATLLVSGSGRPFESGGYVSVGSSTNLLIDSVAYGSGSMVLTLVDGSLSGGSVTAVAGSGAAITPYTPYGESSAELEPSTLISSVNGTITLNGTTAVLQSMDIQVKNNWAEVRPALSRGLLVDQNPGYREVTGNLTFWLRDVDVIRSLGNPRHEGVDFVNPVPISVTLGGNVAGQGQVTINIPNAHLNFAAAEIPESESGSVQVPFTALASAIDNGDNEITLTFAVT